MAKTLVLIFAFVIVSLVVSKGDRTGLLSKFCETGKLEEIVKTCLTENLKSPEDEVKFSSLVDTRFENFKQIEEALCEPDSPESKKLTSQLMKLVLSRDWLPSFKTDPKACILKSATGRV